MHYVYILHSEKDDKLYIGYTSDLERRVIEHQNGLVDSTKDRRPIKLIYYEAFNREDLARTRERQLKAFGSAYKGLVTRLDLKGHHGGIV